MIGWPKPSQVKALEREKVKAEERVKRALAKQKAIAEAKGKAFRGPKRDSLANVRKSPYQAPEWLKLVAAVAKRSKGVCEMCGKAPAVGQPNHLGYADFKGGKRLLVPLTWLLASCRECHVSFHAQYGYRKDLPVYRPGAPVPTFTLDFLKAEE